MMADAFENLGNVNTLNSSGNDCILFPRIGWLLGRATT